MLVDSPTLQNRLDQWDHMDRFGINVPDFFIVHDEGSLDYLFRCFCGDSNLSKIKIFKYERGLDEKPVSNLPNSVSYLKENLTIENVKKNYYLALPFIEESDVIMSGFVKNCKNVNLDDMTIGYGQNFDIPFEQKDEDELKIINFKMRESVPDNIGFLLDVSRIANGFPYKDCRFTFTASRLKFGKLRQHICFWDYQVSGK